MKFVEPDFKKLYDTLKNNERLEKILTDRKILISLEDYFELYGYDEENIELVKYEIETENNSIYENLAYALLDNLDYIKETSVSSLVQQSFLKKEITDAFNFSEDVDIGNALLNEVFYTAKYCYVSSFFQNNYEEFLPQADFREIENNPAILAFLDGVMKEFDKLDCMLTDFKKFKNYQEIPYEYITHLSQLLGCEPKDFMLLETQKKQYRTLAENILDVYAIKGTKSSFELLFNFLGYNIVIKEYYFDRRNYFLIDGINKETKSSNNEKVDYYLTTTDPRKNNLATIACNEIVTQKDITEKLNIKDFEDLVKKYGLLCVLGYNDTYLDEFGDTKLYTGKVFKYFNTNYVTIHPSLKYSKENLSLDELYQLKAITDFLLPKFKQRELVVKIDTEDDSSDDSGGESLDGSNHNGFVMLDSEDWNQDLTSEYISNYKKYNQQKFTIAPKRIKDNGEEVNYYNSLGEQFNTYKEESHNVFYNPISEKIKNINSTKYWGDKIKTPNLTGNMYEVWRVNEKGNKADKQYRNPYVKTEDGIVINKLYLPKDYNLLTPVEQSSWDDLEEVELNGYKSSSLKSKIRAMDNKIAIDSTNNLIDYVSNREYTLEWVENVENFSWNVINSFNTTEADRFNRFVNTHNVINYDYINKYLLAKNNDTIDFEGTDRGVTNYSVVGVDGLVNETSTNLLRNMCSEFCYYIAVVDNKYYIYKYMPLRKVGTVYIRKRRPVIYSGTPKKFYTYQTFKNSLDAIREDNNSFVNNSKEIKITGPVFFFVVNDNAYYKLTTTTTNYKFASRAEKISPYKNEEDKVGDFYIQDGSGNDGINLRRTMTTLEKKAMRDVLLKQYKKINSDKGKLVYASDIGKVLEYINTSVYITTDNHIFGLKPSKIRGKVCEENNNYYLKEFDSYYEGFSEQDDDDNYIFNNYTHEYSWKNISDNVRPIKDNTDKLFNSDKENISKFIFDEILSGIDVVKKIGE